MKVIKLHRKTLHLKFYIGSSNLILDYCIWYVPNVTQPRKNPGWACTTNCTCLSMKEDEGEIAEEEDNEVEVCQEVERLPATG